MMMIFQKAEENREALERMGEDCIAAAHAAGTAAYYMEDGLDGIIKHMPDGRRYLVSRTSQEEIILRELEMASGAG